MDKRIEQKLKEIDESLEIIEESLPAEVNEFKALGLVKDGIYKRLEFCIQNVLDIFSMIYSEMKLGVPSSLDEILTVLEDKKLFPKEIITLAKEMKGMRNILVHRYGKVNDALIFELLMERKDDFEKIKREIPNIVNLKQISKEILKRVLPSSALSSFVNLSSWCFSAIVIAFILFAISGNPSFSATAANSG